VHPRSNHSKDIQNLTLQKTQKAIEMIQNHTSALPFLNWAGGKRWLTFCIDSQFHIPKYNRYIEPFVGSGAMFFHQAPNHAILNDLNEELINAYSALKSDWKKVVSILSRYQRSHSEDFYYEMRSFMPRSIYSRAAKFIYLNRTCFNGIYRVNQRGKFNVPIGTKKNVILETDDFETISNILQGVSFYTGDFEKVIDKAKKGDFIFADPPYTVKHAYNGFVKYNEKLFSWEDQVRLKEALLRASQRGARIMMTNAYHASIKSLYHGTGFKKEIILRNSMIAASNKKRGKYEEYIITNY
jgi:DNA adenine methylase